MPKILIFGGTTEGRELAEYCYINSIPFDVSVATEYGAKMLSSKIKIYCGRLDFAEIQTLILKNLYTVVIDATHPYAEEASKNIKEACDVTSVKYIRVVRECSEVEGEKIDNYNDLVERLNSTSDTILNTMGSKILPYLIKVNNYSTRVWSRVLPSNNIVEYCSLLGFDTSKLIMEKGPFSIEQNISHIKLSGAKILLTKESGTTGGYPEKIKAAKKCKITTLTLVRPLDYGYSIEQIKEMLKGGR